jgi:hypothetical protein
MDHIDADSSELGLDARGMAGEWKQDRRQQSRHDNETNPPQAQAQCECLSHYATDSHPTARILIKLRYRKSPIDENLAKHDACSSDKGYGESRVHRHARPGQSGLIGRQSPHQDHADEPK